MSVISKDTPEGMGVEVHGPFQPEHLVTLNGYRVPYVTVHPLDDGRFHITIDHRFDTFSSVTAEELDNWMPMLANAMAVAAGYSCHGDNCGPANPFTTRMSRLGNIDQKPDLKIVDGDLKK